MRLVRRHLCFANVVACLSLVVALGGTAYAVSKIDGSDIRNGSIEGKKIAKDALSGRQIRESTLRDVRSARTSAITEQLKVSGTPGADIKGALRGAADAGTLLRLSVGESSELIASDPFTIVASCIEVDGQPRIRVEAKTTESGSFSSYNGHFEPGEPASFRTDEDAFTRLGLGVPVMFAAPSGATLHVSSTAYGTKLFGADCLVSAYGVA